MEKKETTTGCISKPLVSNYHFLTCYKCGWESKSMTGKELNDLGVPWYCDDCGDRVTWITSYSDKDLELAEAAARRQQNMKDKSDDDWIKEWAESSAKFVD